MNELNRTSRENGSVLILALILLVVLAALATGAVTTSVQEQRMSANSLNQNIAFQAAETALRSGEGYLESFAIAGTPPPTGTPNCTVGSTPCVATFYGVTPAALPWGTTKAYSVTTKAGVFANAASPPETIIEDLGRYKTGQSYKKANYQGGPVHESEFYRVTAQGAGLTTDAQSMVQSVYALRRQ